MARIRTIKPEFYRHHDLFLAEEESGFPIRVAFSGLWLCADKEGRFKWKPTELKLDILPYDEVNFNDVLKCLVDTGFIIKYTVDKKEYGYIPTFKEHQRITGTEKNYESKLPEFNGNVSESHNVSKVIPSDFLENSETVDNQMAFQSVSLETSRQVGKEYKKGEKRKEREERSIGTGIHENFILFDIYKKPFDEVEKLFTGISEIGFLKWKKFIDFIYENSLSEIFRFRCINPKEFEKLDFPECKWDSTIRNILSTGIEEKHNLFFRIPQFLKYTEKNGTTINGSKKSGTSSDRIVALKDW